MRTSVEKHLQSELIRVSQDLALHATDELVRLANASGGGGTCPEVHEITTTSEPTSGTADLTYDLDGTSDTVTINWDDTAAEVQTAMETHSNVSSGDVVVTQGALPRKAIYIRFAGNLANINVDLPVITDNLVGGQIRMRKASSYDWGA